MSDVQSLTATRALMRDHVAVARQLDRLEETMSELGEGAPGVQRALETIAEVAEFLRIDLEVHLQKEEEALFPPLEEIIGSGAGPAYVMRLEHVDMRRLGAELGQPLGGRRTYADIRQTIRELNKLLGDHIAKEDSILFPMAEQLLDDEAMAAVTAHCDRIAAAFRAQPR